MGVPLHAQMMQSPATAALEVALFGSAACLHRRSLGYEDVGVSYKLVVEQGEWWRLTTAPFSHISLLHLLFNTTALWSVGRACEAALGAARFLQLTAVLTWLPLLLTLGVYRAAALRLGREECLRTTAVGFSCVVFGWMTVLANRGADSALSLLGLFHLPVSAAPFGSLVFTSLLVPQASFVGHLAGIVVGELVSLGALDWLTGFWFWALCGWVVVVHVASLQGGRGLPSFVLAREPERPEVRIVSGVLSRPRGPGAV